VRERRVEERRPRNQWVQEWKVAAAVLARYCYRGVGPWEEDRVSEGLRVDLGSFAGWEMVRSLRKVARRKDWVPLFDVVEVRLAVELALILELAHSGWL